MTVYQALTTYSQEYNYRFTQKHRMIIGALVAKEYRSQFGPDYLLLTTLSIEETGTYTVFDYPNIFLLPMDCIIHAYVEKLRKSKPKRKNEKPKTNPTHPISYASDPPKKRTRKPIPIKPHFSGKKLIEKKQS